MDANYKEKVNNYIAMVPGDNIRKALTVCREYVDAVFDHERWSQEGQFCTDSESRSYWHEEMVWRDKVRRDVHERLIAIVHIANADAKNMEMEPLFPCTTETPRDIIGDIAIKVVDDYFNYRR